jgi:four helix bundle protein
MSTEKIESWRDLLVWQKAHAGALEIYRYTKNFPPEERYRLIDQLCRAAVSVPTNIAEGKGRAHSQSFASFS